MAEDVIAEEYIKGREVTVPILGESVYPILEIVPSHDLYDFECKYTPGMTKYFCPAKLDDGIASLIRKIHNCCLMSLVAMCMLE